MPAPGGRTVRVTASVGVSVGTDLIDADTLVEAADRALYQAKGEGRDRLVGVDLSCSERPVEQKER